MKKIIVYGIGKSFCELEGYINKNFEVIAYCDKNANVKKDCILPSEINKYDFDEVLITSHIYANEIKIELVGLGIDNEKIVSIDDYLGSIDENEEARHKWVIDKLKAIEPGKILLDAGAGESRYKEYCNHLKYIAQDFGEYDPKANNIGLQAKKWNYSGLDIKCDITNIPLDTESIDVILCTEVFEHLLNPILAIKEFSRLLKRGGMLILTAPFCCMTHMAPYFFYNGFSDYWYKHYLENNGFVLKEISNNGNYFKYLLQELWRLESMVEKYIGKDINAEQRTIIQEMKCLMNLWGNEDHKSYQMMRFGTFVVAEKL